MFNQDAAGDMSQAGHVSGGDTAALRPLAATDSCPGSLAVIVFAGAERQASFRLTRPLTVGREPACEIVLADQGASRAHARLSPVSDGIEIADLGSRNGTFVDGRRVTSAIIQAGSIIRIGDALLCVCRLAEEWQAATPSGPLVGGTALAPVRRMISLVGPTELPLLILGETGTGKEVVAHLAHAASGRTGALVAVNCAALPEALVESELFGHAQGAFTGAARGRKGLFAAASEGTLFLDEVGDLPLAAQAKLLRVLEDGLVRPVGGEAAHKVNVRIMSATNRDLGRAASEGRFRPDLLARLAAVEVRMPPLRERPDDLPALAAYLLGRSRNAVVPLEANALEALALYDWPQNVREFDNVLRNAVLVGGHGILFEHLPKRIQDVLTQARQQPGGAAPPAEAMADPRARAEEALRRHGGNVRRASQDLGIARSHFYRIIKRLNIDPGQFRSASQAGTKDAK